MLPKITENKQKSLGKIKLNGGIKPFSAGDSNLTDGVNVWYKNGCLCTRPAFSSGGELSLEGLEADTLSLHRECRKILDGRVYLLLTYVEREQEESATVKSLYINEADFEDRILLKDLQISASSDYQIKILPIKQDSALYLFVTLVNREGGYSVPEGIYSVSEAESVALSDREPYAPTVAVGCLPTSALSRNADIFGRGYEAYNLIGGYYKMTFSTVDRYAESNKMIYPLLHSLWNDNGASGLFDSYVTAEIKTDFGTYTHKVYIPMDSFGGVREENIGADGLYLNVEANVIYFTTADGEVATCTPLEFIENNMTVTAPCPVSIADRSKVFNMSLTANFRGKEDRGERVFLAGNSEPEYSGLVVWSSSDKPLYFPENCQTTLGRGDEKITALGKTAYMLAVFKQGEIYGAFSKDLGLNKGDYPESYAEFPFSSLSNSVGCDCPNTVALCNTRLVWATSNGKIYTIVANTQGSNSTVYEVSVPIEKSLEGFSRADFCSAQATAVFDKYFLNIGKDIFLMDYLSYGFNRLGSFYEKQTVREQIPWWHWQLAWNGTSFLLAGEGTVTLAKINADRLELLQSGDGETDFGAKPIESSFTTSAFDFGDVTEPKVITEVILLFGRAQGNRMSVRFFTDNGTDSGRIELVGKPITDTSPTPFGIKVLRPKLSPCFLFGLQLKAKSPFSLESIDIKYR